MAERESAIEKHLVDGVANAGGVALKLSVPGRRGYQDRVCFMPHGRVFLVEVKRPKGGVLAELQKVRRAEMEALGHRVYVVKNRGEVDAALQKELAYPVP